MAKRRKRLVTSQAAVARCFGVAVRTVANWLAEGCPGKPQCYDLDAIAKWRKTTDPAAPAADPMLAGPSSPALERYRDARAKLAEIELERQRGAYVAVDDVHELHTRIAGVLRRAGEVLQRKFGLEAQQILDDALDDFEREALNGGCGNGAPSIST